MCLSDEVVSETGNHFTKLGTHDTEHLCEHEEVGREAYE